MFGFVLLSTFLPLTSCDELFEEDDCKEYYNYYFKSWVDAVVFQDSQPISNIKVDYSYTKHYCDGRTPYNDKFYGITDINGVAIHRSTVGFNLHNNHDYVVVEVKCLGETWTRTIDYNDFNGDDSIEIPIEKVFNF